MFISAWGREYVFAEGLFELFVHFFFQLLPEVSLLGDAENGVAVVVALFGNLALVFVADVEGGGSFLKRELEIGEIIDECQVLPLLLFLNKTDNTKSAFISSSFREGHWRGTSPSLLNSFEKCFIRK